MAEMASGESKGSELTARDVRALLTPILSAFRGIAQLEAIVDAAVLEEGRLKTTRADRLALEQQCASLRREQAELAAAVKALKGDRAEQQRATDQAQREHQAAVAACADALEADRRNAEAERRSLALALEAAQAAHREALGQLRQAREAAEGELSAARTKVTALHAQLAGVAGG